ncbi:MAG: DUF2095 family protein [Promethearchaeota archaeon]
MNYPDDLGGGAEERKKRRPLDDPLARLMFEEEEFKKRYPNLYGEIASGSAPKIPIDAYRHEEEFPETGEDQGTYASRDPFAHFDPGARDFIQRAHTLDEALEVVEFLLDRGEIGREERDQIVEQLETGGLESFGKHRTWGHYDREARALSRR